MKIRNQHSIKYNVLLVIIWSQLLLVGSYSSDLAAGQGTNNSKSSNLTNANGNWLESTKYRIQENSTLYRYMVSIYGPPSSYQGNATVVFEDRSFGLIEFKWIDKLIYSVQTLPPESSIIILRFNKGYSDKKKLFQQVQNYIRERGLQINWTKPQIIKNPSSYAENYVSQSTDVNANVIYEYNLQGLLVSVKITLAL
jgi:hypothetical protein